MPSVPESYLIGLETENAKLKAALEAYADPENWRFNNIFASDLDEWVMSVNERCVGPDIAREALGMARLEYHPDRKKDRHA